MVFNVFIMLIIELMIICISYSLGRYEGYGKGFDDAFNYVIEYLKGMELDKVSEEVRTDARHK